MQIRTPESRPAKSDVFHLSALPISDVQAEKGYVGSLVWDPRILDEVQLPDDAFYLQDLASVVKVIRAKREAGEAVDFLTLASALTPLGMDDDYWNRTIAECVTVAQHPGNAAHYARVIKERWVRRTACQAASELMNELYHSSDVQAVLGRHHEELTRLTESSEADDATDCPAGLNKVLQGWKLPQSSGLATGFPDVDHHIGGWQAQRLYLLAAKTAIGKSALAINFGSYVARNDPVLFISLEMPETEVFSRLASSVLRRTSDEMRSTVYVDQDTSELADGFNNLSRLKFKVDDRGGRTISSISAQARKHVRRHGLGLLVVDYLGLVEPSDKRSSRYEQLGTISRGLKLIAKNLRIPVLALCQLNRQADADGVRPQLHHLRESGNLEQDADVVMFIHRERDAQDAELIIAKNRSGPTGVVNLLWDHKIVRYDSQAWKRAEVYDPTEGASWD